MIQVKNLCKSYKKKNAQILEDISLQITDGEVVAMLGHNGCGKSTLLKCLVGVIKPTSGTVTIDGIDTFRQQKKIRNKIGVVFNQKPSFIIDLEVMDNLLYFKAIYEIPDKQFQEILDLVDHYLNIKSLYHKPYRKLSFGERVKCEIASVLLHIPQYIFLDEPTIGLDYNAKEGLYQLIQYFNKTYHSTILVITHEVDYIQSICNHAVIISEGRIRYDGSIDEIMKRIKQKYSLSITYDACVDPDGMEEF